MFSYTMAFQIDAGVWTKSLQVFEFYHFVELQEREYGVDELGTSS